MKSAVEKLLENPEALDKFERGLEDYLARVGNLQIPFFYVNEDGLPLGQIYSFACQYWETGKPVHPSLAQIDRKFYVEHLWPRWNTWREAEKAHNLSFGRGHGSSPRAAPSLTGLMDRDIGNSRQIRIVELFCGFLSLYLAKRIDSFEGSEADEGRGWDEIIDIVEYGGRPSFDDLGRIDEFDSTLDDFAEAAYGAFDHAARKVLGPSWFTKDYRIVSASEDFDLIDMSSVCIELVSSLNIEDPLSLQAFLTDLSKAEEKAQRNDPSFLPDCATDLMWDLAEVNERKKIATFAPSNTQLLDRLFSSGTRNKSHNWQERFHLETYLLSETAVYLACAKSLILQQAGLLQDPKVYWTNLVLSSLDPVDACVANIPRGAKITRTESENKKPAKSIAVEPLAIRNIADSLLPNGRAIVMVSNSVLFSGSKAFVEIRRFLLEECCLEDVIALRSSHGTGLALHTSIDLNLLVFSKKAPTATVRFTVLRADDGTLLDHKEHQQEKHAGWIKRFIETSEAFEREGEIESRNHFGVKGKDRLAKRLRLEETWTESIEELHEKELNLLPRNLKSSQWMKLIEGFRKQDDITILKLGDLFDVVSPRALSSRKLQETTTENGTPVLEANRFKESRYSFDRLLPPKRKVQLPDDFPEAQRLRRGDIAISTKGTLGKVVVIERGEYLGAVPGSTITILRAKELSEDQSGFHEAWLGGGSELDGSESNQSSHIRKRKLNAIKERALPLYVSAFFQTDAFQNWLSLMSRGTGIQTITNKGLREFLVPVTLNEKRAKDIQRVYERSQNSFAENQTELENILLGRHQPFEKFIESDSVKKFLEFFHQPRNSRSGSLSAILAGPFDSGSAFSVHTGARKKSANRDSRDLLKEMRPLVSSVFALGQETAFEFYRAESRPESRREETDLMRTFESFTFPPEDILACTDSALQFGLWQQALNQVKGLDVYESSPETKKLISAAKNEESREWPFSESATLLFGITSYFEAELKRALQDIDFEVGLVSQPAISESQEELEIEVYYKNRSRLPLCAVTVRAGQDIGDPETTSHPDFDEWGQHQCDWLYPGETHRFSVIIPDQESWVFKLTDQQIEEDKRFDEFIKQFDLEKLPSLEEKLRKKGNDPEEIDKAVSSIRERKKRDESIEKLDKLIQKLDRMKKSEETSDKHSSDVEDSLQPRDYDDPRKIKMIFSITGHTLSEEFCLTASEWAPDIWHIQSNPDGLFREDNQGLLVTIRPNADIGQTIISQESVNPYIVGNPIDRKEMLFGRDQVLSDIKQQLGTSGTQSNPVLIEGNRRTGKTSILHELQRSISTEEMIPVYVSLQSGEGSKDARPGLDTEEVFRLIARQIGFALKESGVEVGLPGESLTDPEKNFRFQFTRKLENAFKNERPFDTLRLYVEEVLSSIAPRKVLLMLDEFDHIHVGTRSGVTNPQVPVNIRSLVHEHKNLALIISGTKELEKIRDDYWSMLFGLAFTIPVSGLSEDAARDLVQKPAAGQLNYQTRAVEEIVRLCGSQPFLIQTLCSRIFSGAMETQNPNVDNTRVDAAAERMATDNEHFRNLFYREISSDLQRIIFMLILKRSEADGARLNRGDLETALYESRVPYIEEKLDDEIDHLVGLEIIREQESPTGEMAGYEPLVPLFGIWINQNVDYDELVRALENQAS
jgi:hypothetical protein